MQNRTSIYADTKPVSKDSVIVADFMSQIWRRSGVFMGNFENISPVFLVFLLLTLNKQILAGLSLHFDSFKSKSY